MIAGKAEGKGAYGQENEERHERDEELVVEMGKDAVPVGRSDDRLRKKCGKGPIFKGDEFVKDRLFIPRDFGKIPRDKTLRFFDLLFGVAR